MTVRFPDGFRFGVATAAYQIEGAADEDGRGPSIWDTFCRTPGKVLHGDTGDIACDHYHRVESDLDLIRDLGVDSYRFSIAWPRIVPDGAGPANQKGIDFYKRVLDGLHERGIAPMVTLYHWDLPQALQENGGWANRNTVDRFTDYAATVVGALGDAVPMWVTFNEPFCSSMVSNLQGRHAPGLVDLDTALRVCHHLLLSHGRTLEVIKEAAPQAEAGITINLSDIAPLTDSDADIAAAQRLDGHENRWYLDPLFKGAYPMDMVGWYAKQARIDFIESGDLDTIAAPADFVGINYYETKTVYNDVEEPFHNASVVRFDGEATAGGLDVRPAGLGRILRRVSDDYTKLPIYITENGAAFNDYVDPEGGVDDIERVSYLEKHFAEARGAIDAGVDLRGYYVWSLFDNLEWADGYGRRFGIVYVDFPTQKRIPKASARWYQQLIADNHSHVARAHNR